MLDTVSLNRTACARNTTRRACLYGEVGRRRVQAAAAQRQAQHRPDMVGQAVLLAGDNLCLAVQPERPWRAVCSPHLARRLTARLPFARRLCAEFSGLNHLAVHWRHFKRICGLSTSRQASLQYIPAHVEHDADLQVADTPGSLRGGRCCDHGRLATSAAPVAASRQRATSSRRPCGCTHLSQHVDARERQVMRHIARW